MRSSARLVSRSRSYSRARSSACSASPAAVEAIANSSSSRAFSRSKRNSTAPTGLPAGPDRHGHCRANERREYCGALGEVGLEGRSVVGADGSTLPKCDREQRRLLEREPATWDLGLRGDSDRVDDEDVVALEQAERSALRAEDRRRALGERTRDLDGRHGSRELAAERLQRLGALQRALDLHGGVGRTFPPDPEPARDDDDERPDCEVHRPSGHVFRTSDLELSMRPDEQPERERPTDDERHRRWTDSTQPRSDGERADERRVHGIAAHRQQTERADEPDDRQHEREPVALASRPRLRPRELFPACRRSQTYMIAVRQGRYSSGARVQARPGRQRVSAATPRGASGRAHSRPPRSSPRRESRRARRGRRRSPRR